MIAPVRATPRWRSLCEGIEAGQVYGYPAWAEPRAWRRDGLGESEVTGKVLALLDAGRAEWDLGRANGGGRTPVRLTDDGRTWLSRPG